MILKRMIESILKEKKTQNTNNYILFNAVDINDSENAKETK
jgi:hypothetical protein